MTWGSGWQVAPCDAVDGTGQRCSLAAGHKDDHRTAAAVARNERSAWVWRILIFAGVGLAAAYVLLPR